jgi:hypothetical protein
MLPLPKHNSPFLNALHCTYSKLNNMVCNGKCQIPGSKDHLVLHWQIHGSYEFSLYSKIKIISEDLDSLVPLQPAVALLLLEHPVAILPQSRE